MALFVTIYLSLMGKQGMEEAAQLSYAGAHYLCDKLIETGKFRLAYDKPFFNEFYVKYTGNSQLSTLNSQLSTHSLYQRFIDAGFLGGVKLEDGLLFAVTEKRTKEEIDNLVKIAAS